MQSLPQDLEETLKALLPLLPPSSEEHAQLKAALSSDEEDKVIPYTLLRSLSKFASTNKDLLESNGLETSNYAMISLLAGTTADPRTRFPDPPPKEKPEPWSKTTKEITTILNCIFSVLGSGAAAWYATEHTGWRTEWCVLFAFMAAIAVAVTEMTLYILWTENKEVKDFAKKSLIPTTKRKKREPQEKGSVQDEAVSTQVEKRSDNGLRQRVQ